MDLIQALKDNEKPFGLMSKEMQDNAREIGREHFETWWNGSWGHNIPSNFDKDITTRLKSSYAEEPDTIELEIILDYKNSYSVYAEKEWISYTNCPALCPKEGYRFSHFYSKEGTIWRKTIWVDGLGETVSPEGGCAVYRRIK